MSILFPILLAAATMTASPAVSRVPHLNLGAPAPTRTTLSVAVSEAARRATPIRVRRSSAGSRLGRSQRPADRNSFATRTTAIFAGAILGGLVGTLGGAMIDGATGNGECMTGAAVGLPVGAALGGVLTAYWVR